MDFVMELTTYRFLYALLVTICKICKVNAPLLKQLDPPTLAHRLLSCGLVANFETNVYLGRAKTVLGLVWKV